MDQQIKSNKPPERKNTPHPDGRPPDRYSGRGMAGTASPAHPDNSTLIGIAPAEFDENGYLPPGFHAWDLPSLAHHTVAKFPESTTRPKLFGGYTELCGCLSLLELSGEQWIGGSFVTQKENPGDIDLANLLDIEALDHLRPDQQQLLIAYMRGPVTKSLCHCDSYFILRVPENHPLRADFEKTYNYWLDLFGKDRADNPKGIVSRTIQPPPKPIQDEQDDDATATA